MQEEVTQRTVALCVEATKLSAGMLQQAMKKVLDEMQKGVTGHKTKLHHGKQTLRQLMKHLDVLLPPELLDAIDPVPFGNHAMREEQGCFTSKGYLTLSGDEWEHERPREKQTEKKPSIKERLEQSRKECANQSKAQPHREKSAPEL